MSLAALCAALMFFGVVAYAIFAGADFGSGVWDLLAGDAETGGARRHQIDRSIGPVWEANHVWLIYVLVFMWTAFPRAFAAMITTLFVPWLFVGLGIVLRGSGFAFRKFAETLRQARFYGAAFAASSVITPFFLGMIAGAIASGRVHLLDGRHPDLLTSWTGPTSWVGGVLAVLTCSFLAATFLAADSHRAGDQEMADYFGRRALVSGVLSGAVAMIAIAPIESDAHTLADGLQGKAAPFVAISAVAGLFALWRLRAQRYARARVGAVIAVAAVVIGWGVAQYPDVLVDHAEIGDVAGARSTLYGLLIVFAIAAVTAVPAMVWLFVLVNRRDWADDAHRAPSAG
ncbi:MAG: putative cytochrome bd-I oxidase subunit [Ilumatobacteraceae bacterium]|nr:putative cytochrome bd-I oxidase subunit [Ilumatobacteraceae bacterium]